MKRFTNHCEQWGEFLDVKYWNTIKNVHKYDEPLDDWQVERFTTAKGVPSTWGEAVNLRIGKQNSTFRKNYQYGSFDIKNVK